MYCSIDLNYCLRNNYCPNGLDLIIINLFLTPPANGLHLSLFPAKKCSPVQLPRESAGEQTPRPFSKGLVFDESIQLTHYATVTVYRCPDRMCGKPCVTLRAFKMHAKCVHKGIELTPVIQEAKANFICKVRN